MSNNIVDSALADKPGRHELRAEFDELDEHLYEFMDVLWHYVEPHPILANVQGMEGTIEHTIAYNANETLKHWDKLLSAIRTLVDAVESQHLPGRNWNAGVPRH